MSRDCRYDTFFKSRRRTVHYHKPQKEESRRPKFSLSTARSRKVDSPSSTLSNCRLPTSRDIAYNVPAAWRRRGVRYSSCGLQTFIFPLHFLRRYTPACAKPPVSRWQCRECCLFYYAKQWKHYHHLSLTDPSHFTIKSLSLSTSFNSISNVSSTFCVYDRCTFLFDGLKLLA